MSKVTIEEEGLGPLEQGRHRYQRKDYSGALKAFSQAIDISTHNILLNALDHRAATYEKLGQLQPALRDAKRMIDLKPNLSKGYLRCGKILHLKNEDALALRIYERGLNKVKVGTDDQRTLLQTMYNKMRRSQGPGRTFDPLEHLPTELAEMVCQRLTMRDRIVCLAVSKSWKRLLESSHSLWTTLDTTSARKALTQASLKAYMKRSNYGLTDAVITSKASFDAYKMGYLTRTCKQLKSIDIRGTGMIGDSLISALPNAHRLKKLSVSNTREISLSSVTAALMICQRSLIEASFLCVNHPRFAFHDFPALENLQTIQLRNASAEVESMIDLPNLCNAAPNLRRVTYVGWNLAAAIINLKPWSSLQYLDLSNTRLAVLPQLPPSLKHLIIRSNPSLLEMMDEEPFILPALETIDITGSSMSHRRLRTLTCDSIENGSLKKLFVGGRLNDFDRLAPANEFPPSHTVEELSLEALLIAEEHIMAIADLYPKLRSLDLSHTKITGVAVKYFVERGITTLRLNECSLIGLDAIEWARGRGIHVEFRFPSRSGQPSRFRDAFASI